MAKQGLFELRGVVINVQKKKKTFVQRFILFIKRRENNPTTDLNLMTSSYLFPATHSMFPFCFFARANHSVSRVKPCTLSRNNFA